MLSAPTIDCETGKRKGEERKEIDHKVSCAFRFAECSLRASVDNFKQHGAWAVPAFSPSHFAFSLQQFKPQPQPSITDRSC